MKKPRPVESDAMIERLERRHRELKMRVAELDTRLYLTVGEELLRIQLKKQKLAAKDRLSDLRSGASA